MVSDMVSDGRGLPTTADEAEEVLRMRWLVWVGTALAVICVMLAFSSFEVGLAHDSAPVQWGAPLLFLLLALVWATGVRRLRARVDAARDILARDPRTRS